MRSNTFGSLFAAFLALYAATAGGRLYVNDAHVKMMTARAILDHGSLAIPPVGKLTAFSPKDGKPYGKFGILHSILFLPAAAAGKGLVAAGMVAPEKRGLADGAIAGFSGALFTALSVALFYAWGRRLVGGGPGPLRAALLLGTATMLWPYAKRSWSETPQTTLLLGAFLALAAARERSEGRRIFLAGILAGATVALRVTGLVLLPLFLIPLLLPPWHRRGTARRIALFAGGTALVALPLLLGVNWIRFGSPTSLFAWRMGGFTTPFFLGVAGLLASPGESIFLYSPIALAGLLLLPRLWRVDRAAFLLSLLVPLALLLLYAPWWFHAYTWGPRFLLPALPFLLIPLLPKGVWESRRWRRKIALLALLSVAIQILGVAVHLGGLPALERPLVHHGLLPPDRPLTREETWFHPLRTRLVSHALALADAAAGRAPLPIDLWPFTLRETLGVPLRITVPVEAILLLLAAAGLRRLFRKAWGKKE